MIQKVFIVTDIQKEKNQELQDLLEHIKVHYKVPIELRDYKDKIVDNNDSMLTLLYLDDLKIKSFLKNHLYTNIRVGFIPNKDSIRSIGSYGVSQDIHEAMDDAFNESNISCIDILTCNDELVFTNVVIGDVHGLNNKDIDKQNIFTKIKHFYANIKNLSFKEYTFTTAKMQTIQTVATGIMILEHNSKLGKDNFIDEGLSMYDGKLNAFILSPTSILSYIYYLFLILFHSRFDESTLSKSLGLIKTSKLEIKSPKPMDYMSDGIFISAKDLTLEILKDSLFISIGRNFINSTQELETQDDDKEVIKTQNLPKGDMKNLLIAEPIPFFKKAEEEDFKELFISIRENAKPSSVFIILMILSTLLATTGLFQNSTPVIIGAMILAPLMAPIISLSMGVARGDSSLMKNSLTTLFYGIVTSLIFASIYAYLMPLNLLTDEMRGRLSPNILDLMVAIISGVAGAYANSKSEVAKSLAGVAIAVALIPPLTVTGIGLGWGDFHMIYGSFLLFTTNLVGITLAAAVTFIILGYSPLHRAKKGIIYTSTILAIVTIPLIISFGKAIQQNKIIHLINNKILTTNEKTINIRVLNVDLSKNIPKIYIETISSSLLEKEDLHSVKKEIESRLNKKIVLKVSSGTIIN